MVNRKSRTGSTTTRAKRRGAAKRSIFDLQRQRRKVAPPSQAFRERAKALHSMLSDYINQGYSARRIAAELNKLKIESPTGRQWRATTVDRAFGWGLPDTWRRRITDIYGREVDVVFERCDFADAFGFPAVLTYYDDDIDR
jgi:hypothetical protein